MARTQYPSTSKVIVPQSKIVTLSEQQKEEAMWDQLLRDHHSNCEKSKCNDKRINGLYACQFSSINGRMYNAYLRYRRRREAYKSKLCRNFHGSGFCITGKECPFVHNIWEPIDSEHGNNFLFQSEMSAAFKTSLNTSYMNKCAFYSDSSSFRMSDMSQSDVQDRKLSSLRNYQLPAFFDDSNVYSQVPAGWPGNCRY